MRVIVIGLDGVNWDVLNYMVHKGVLKVIPALAEKGRWAILRSTIPPITAPAWVSFATGVNPGKHGCFSFIKPGRSLAVGKPISSLDIKVPTLYELLEREGFTSILINLPVSYPPKIKEGIVITSLMTRGDNFIFPREVIKKVPELRRYRLVPDTSLYITGRISDYIRDIRLLERVRFRCAAKLLKFKWDFFFILFSGTDFAHHAAYDKIFRNNRQDKVANEILKLYKEIDEYIGYIMRRAPDDALIILMSDHGFKTYRGLFSINAWLRRKGLLKLEITDVSVRPHAFAKSIHEAMDSRLTRPLIKTLPIIVNRLCGQNTLTPLATALINILPRIMPVLTHIEIGTKIYPKESVAYSPHISSHGIYINVRDKFKDGIVDPSEYGSIRAEIIEELNKLREPSGKAKLFEAVLKKEEVYKGKELDKAPDILIIPRNYSTNWNNPLSLLREQPFNFHDLFGILVMYCPGHRVNYKVPTGCLADIYDIAPTILKVFSINAPTYMDGHSLIDH